MCGLWRATLACRPTCSWLKRARLALFDYRDEADLFKFEIHISLRAAVHHTLGVHPVNSTVVRFNSTFGQPVRNLTKCKPFFPEHPNGPGVIAKRPIAKDPQEANGGFALSET